MVRQTIEQSFGYIELADALGPLRENVGGTP